jgi:regulator of protease activity HflC (stomatin/prohibitin superfamily)
MSTRTQNYTMSSLATDGPKGSVDSAVTVLGQDGGAATVNATLLYRLDRAKATDVYRNLGRNYGPALVRPTARGCVRESFTKYPITTAASTASAAIEDSIAQCIKTKLESVGLNLQAFQLRSITLDPNVQSAVTLKVAAQQKLQQQLFDVATAQKQADITRIQALATNQQALIAECGGHTASTTINGQPDQTIIPNVSGQCTSSVLTQPYLQLQYIQALNNLAATGKGTTVVLPFGQNVTPLVTVPTG